MKRLPRWLMLSGASIGVVAALAAGLGFMLLHVPRDPSGADQIVRVENGQSLRAVRAELVRQGIVSRAAPLLVWAGLRGDDRRIKPGDYRLSARQTPRRILDALVHGEAVFRRVAIPEGLVGERILELLADGIGTPEGELRRAAADSAWLASLGLPRPSPEGYLFPATYQFEPQAEARKVLGTLIETGRRRLDDRRRGRADSLGLTIHEVITLASIVEAEAAVAGERARIAAVFHHRLRLGWPLQADPTVAYAIGEPGRRLSRQDLEVASPYNTYLRPGLPPGPICSPGIDCIDAVLWPLKDCEDLYFVARGDGTHHFSATLEDHNRARQRFRDSR